LTKTTTKKPTKRKARKPRPRVKKRNWREALDALKSDATYEDLLRFERTAKPAKEVDQRRKVPIQELIVAEKVFQWRGAHSDLHAEEGHMRELMRVLELGRDLAPIVIKRLERSCLLSMDIIGWPPTQRKVRQPSQCNISTALWKGHISNRSNSTSETSSP
jgi:hypothetical protein